MELGMLSGVKVIPDIKDMPKSVEDQYSPLARLVRVPFQVVYCRKYSVAILLVVYSNSP